MVPQIAVAGAGSHRDRTESVPLLPFEVAACDFKLSNSSIVRCGLYTENLHLWCRGDLRSPLWARLHEPARGSTHRIPPNEVVNPCAGRGRATAGRPYKELGGLVGGAEAGVVAAHPHAAGCGCADQTGRARARPLVRTVGLRGSHLHGPLSNVPREGGANDTSDFAASLGPGLFFLALEIRSTRRRVVGGDISSRRFVGSRRFIAGGIASD